MSMNCKEMTLGEEIINLATKGVDVSVIERMYKKYMALNNEPNNPKYKLGDKINIPITGYGSFTATCHKIENGRAYFVFDECIDVRAMNKVDTTEGGFENSDLYEWLNTELINKFPKELRKRIDNLTIPSVGEVFGDERLPLMENRDYRVSKYKNRIVWYWLRDVVSAAGFACVSHGGYASYANASDSNGVRPSFWLDLR